MLGPVELMAYLVMMAPRLGELRRVMKSTASLYLHCDPTASHYLKVVLDAVFGPTNFRNEIIWQRTMAKGLMSRRLPDNHDVILAYQKTPEATWNVDETFRPYDASNPDEKTAGKYTQRDPDGRRYQLTSLINPNADRPNLTYEFLGVRRVWRWTRARMQAAYGAGLVVQPSPGAVPSFKRYLDQQRGRAFGDVWTDIPPVNSQAQERVGYPTQKPGALLDRILRTSSREGDVVLDPFCGCGTAVVVAEQLKRGWIGIDIAELALTIMRRRFKRDVGDVVYDVVREPRTLTEAIALARSDRHQFENWALGLIGARRPAVRYGADRGIDARLVDEHGRVTIVSVKSGKPQVKDVRDLRGVLERERAALGVLIGLYEPTGAMKTEAATAGVYEAGEGLVPRLQLLTVARLLAGHRILSPPFDAVAKPAPTPRTAAQFELPLITSVEAGQLQIEDVNRVVPWQLVAPRASGRRAPSRKTAAEAARPTPRASGRRAPSRKAVRAARAARRRVDKSSA